MVPHRLPVYTRATNALKLIVMLSLLALAAGTFTSSAAAMNFGAAQNATTQVGSPDWTSRTMASGASMARGMVEPNGVAVDGSGSVYVSDSRTGRIMRWASDPSSNGQDMDTSIMNPDKKSWLTGCASDRLNGAEQISVAGDGPTMKMVIADRYSSRVMLIAGEPTADGAGASLALGQPNTYSCGSNRNGTAARNTINGAVGVWTDGTRIAVSDSDNNRVLLWDSWPTVSGADPDHVLGQADFISIDQNRGGTIGANTLNDPRGLFFAPAENGGAGRLYVADTDNNRVLVWDSWPTTNGVSANWVLGQPDMASNACSPYDRRLCHTTSVASYGTGTSQVLALNTQHHHRVFIVNGWDDNPINYPTYSQALGQPNLYSTASNRGQGTTSMDSLRAPTQVVFDASGRLWVADSENHRAVRFPAGPTATATRVLGHTSGTASLPGDAIGMLSSHVAGSSTTAYSDGMRVGAADDGSGTLLVVDGYQDALMQWDGGLSSDNAPWSYRWGQPNSAEAGEGGPSSNTSGVLAARPNQVWTDGTRMLLADTGHNRVLAWTSLPAASSTPPDYVIGQSSFTASSSGSGPQDVRAPYGVTSNGSDVVVSDTGNNRLTVYKNFFAAPTNQPTASYVIGQSTLTGTSSGLSATQLDGPAEIDLDQDVLAIADRNNNRLLTFAAFSTLSTSGAAANAVIGQSNMTSKNYGTIAQAVTGVTTGGNAVAWTTNQSAATLYIQDPIPTSGAIVSATQLTDGGSYSPAQNSYRNPVSVAAARGRLWVASQGTGRVMAWDDTTTPTITTAPSVTQVRCDGTVDITWATSESTTTEVYWGTTVQGSALAYPSSTKDLTYSGLTHPMTISVPAPGIPAPTTYYFSVRSVDWAGHTVEQAGGSFIVPQTCAPPTGMFGDDVNAQTGHTNPSLTNTPPILASTPHTSFVNSSGVSMDSQETEVWSTPPEDAAGLWHLNNNGAADTNATDQSPFTWTGTAGYASDGKFGDAMRFDTTNGASTPHQAALSRSNDFTVDIWFRTSAPVTSGGYAIPIHKGQTSAGCSSGAGTRCNYSIEFDATSSPTKLCGVVVNASTPIVEHDLCTDATGLLNNRWHHAALTVDSSNVQRFYVDGQPVVGTATLVGGAFIGSNPLRLSVDNGGTNSYSGDIDEVHYAPRAYPPDAILGYYRTQRPHAQRLWASATTPIVGNCADTARCTDMTYAGPTDILRDGARYYARNRQNTLNNNYWSEWANDWFETESTTALTVTVNPTAALGTALPGVDMFASSTVQVQTNAAGGYQLSATDNDVTAGHETWGLTKTPGAADQLPDLQDGSSLAPILWPASTSGFFGMTVRSASSAGGRLTQWNETPDTGPSTGENDITHNLYTGIGPNSVLLHQRLAYNLTPDNIVLTWRANTTPTLQSGAYEAHITLTAVASP